MRSNSSAPLTNGRAGCSAPDFIQYPPNSVPPTSKQLARVWKIRGFLTELQRVGPVRVNTFGQSAGRGDATIFHCLGLFPVFSGYGARRHDDELLIRGAPAVRGVQELARPYRRNRPAEQVALRLADSAVGRDELELLVGFDALDHDRHAEIGRQPRHAAK